MGNPAKVNQKLFTEPAAKPAPASSLKKGKKG
jgi:hypothetical protein